MVRKPCRAIAADDHDAGIAGAGQAGTRLIGQVRLDVVRDHRPGAADDLRDQRRVIPGPGPDLQHTLPGGQPELLKHDRHHGRLGGRADRKPVGIRLDHDRHVLIGLRCRFPRQEHVPRNRQEGHAHRRASQPAGPQASR
jgi:hypothetical protein